MVLGLRTHAMSLDPLPFPPFTPSSSIGIGIGFLGLRCGVRIGPAKQCCQWQIRAPKPVFVDWVTGWILEYAIQTYKQCSLQMNALENCKAVWFHSRNLHFTFKVALIFGASKSLWLRWHWMRHCWQYRLAFASSEADDDLELGM